jgi:hypothetical protein
MSLSEYTLSKIEHKQQDQFIRINTKRHLYELKTGLQESEIQMKLNRRNGPQGRHF